MSAEKNEDEPLWGAEQIAPVLNRTIEQTRYLLRKRLIPAKKVGHFWVSSRAQLREHIAPEHSSQEKIA